MERYDDEKFLETMKRLVKETQSVLKQSDEKIEDIIVNYYESGFPVSKDTWYKYTSFIKPKETPEEKPKSKPEENLEEKPKEKLQAIKVGTLYDFCQYTNVSADYLLGLNDCRVKEASAKQIQEDFGLSDEAIQTMAFMNRHNDIGLLPVNYKKCGEMSFLNEIIVNFPKVILTPAIEYFKAYENYMDFIEKHGKDAGGKKSEIYLDLEGIPVGLEDILIEKCQKLKNTLDIKRMNILSELERFLLSFRKILIAEQEDN